MIKYTEKVFLKTVLFITLIIFPLALFAFIDYPYASQLQTIRRPLIPLNETGQETLTGRVSLRWMNVWAYSNNRYVIDGEEAQAEGTIKYSWKQKYTLGFALPMIYQGGGALDSPIETFHRMTGVTQAKRDQFKENTLNVSYEPLGRYYALFENNPVGAYARLNQNRIYPRNPGDPPLTLNEIQDSALKDYIIFKYPELAGRTSTEAIGLEAVDRAGMSNARSFLELLLIQSGHHKFYSGLQIKIPGKSIPYMATPGWDESIYLVHEYDINKNLLFKTGISFTRFDYTKFPWFNLPREQWVLRTSMEYNIGIKGTIISEYLVFSKPVDNMGKLSRPGHMVTLGYEKKSPKGKMTIAVIEDLINFNNTPDIGFMASAEASM